MSQELPVPTFYDPARSADVTYDPDAAMLLEAAAGWREEHGLRPASGDPARVTLLLIDCQKDFCFPEGALFAGGRSGRGALEDSDRIARFVYRHLHRLTEIIGTLDTHFPHQIFFPAFWQDAEGAPPAPHTVVTAEDVRSGRFRPRPEIAARLSEGDADWLREYAEFYCRELERQGKYRLYLWPPHCLLGSRGHTIAGVLQEARLFHAFARDGEAPLVTKGMHPLTENYSVFAPEVRRRPDGKPLAGRDRHLVRRLLEADAVVVAGQASSHCVRSSVDDLLEEIRGLDPAFARKLRVLEDGMSPVAVPDPDRPGEFLADFTEEAEQALARWEEQGVLRIRTTDPPERWMP